MRAFGAYLERDQNGAVVGFSGLALRPTAHTFVVGGRRLHTWQDAHPDGEVLDLQAAFALGCGTVAPLTAAGAGAGCC